MNVKKPPPAEWHYKFGTRVFWQAKEDGRLMFRTSRITFFPLIVYTLCSLIMHAVYTVFISGIIHTQLRSFVSLGIHATFLMAFLCWGVCWATNPGFLPYDWDETKRPSESYTLDELRDGCAITWDQKKWGKTVGTFPPRCFFSGTSGWGVLKADHLCYFIGHWIGLKNMRFFIQAVIYGSLFLILFLISCVSALMITSSWLDRGIIAVFVACDIYIGKHHLIQLGRMYSRIVLNQTDIEQAQERNCDYNRGLRANLEEIFGSIRWCWLWWLPIPLALPNDGLNFTEAEPTLRAVPMV